MPGDVVRRMIEGEDSQRGHVRTTHVNCHLQIIGTNKVLCNIDSKLLQPIMVIAVRNSSCGKVMFSQVSVSHSVHGGGVLCVFMTFKVP